MRLFHSSVEIFGIQLHCSLDEPLHIFNVYRHPNSNTPFSFYSNLFAFASTNKYVLFVGDFNAHHSDWEDHRIDLQGEHISRTYETHHLVMERKEEERTMALQRSYLSLVPHSRSSISPSPPGLWRFLLIRVPYRTYMVVIISR